MYRYQGFGFYSARPLMSTCVFIGVFVISFGVIYVLSMWNQRACSKQGVFGFLFHSQRMMKQTVTQAGNESDTTKTQCTMNALYAARNDEYSFWQLMKRYALPATLVLTLAWSFCLIIHFPGTITFDTAAQMLQIDGLSPWRANHPPATTVLYGAFFLLGDIIGSRNIGLFLFCALQLIATSFAFATGFVYLKFLGVKHSLIGVLFVFCLILPLFPLAAECMTKDYTLALIWVFWFIGFIEAVRTKGRIAQRNSYCILMFIISLLMILSKKPSSYLIIVSTLVFLLYARRSGVRFVVTSMLSVLVYSVLIESMLFSALGIKPAVWTEIMSVPVQQTARYVIHHEHELTPSERDAINAVLPIGAIVKLYDPELSDPVRWKFNSHATREELARYLQTWAACMLKDPIVYLEAVAMNTYDLFYPSSMLEQFECLIPWASDDWLVDFLLTQDTYDSSPATRALLVQQLSRIYSEPLLEGARDNYSECLNDLNDTPIGSIVLSKALYASWIPGLALIVYLARRNGRAFVAHVPILLSILILCLSPVTQSRYITPLFYVSWFLIALMSLPKSAWVRPWNIARQQEI